MIPGIDIGTNMPGYDLDIQGRIVIIYLCADGIDFFQESLLELQ